MKVEDLLNPAPQEQEGRTLASPSYSNHGSSFPAQPQSQSQSPPRARGLKPAKDAPIFRKAPTKGEVLFPPHEAEDDEELAKEHRALQIFPRGEISEHCHHIPYSSDKKTFLSKTGRDAFEGEHD